MNINEVVFEVVDGTVKVSVQLPDRGDGQASNVGFRYGPALAGEYTLMAPFEVQPPQGIPAGTWASAFIPQPPDAETWFVAIPWYYDEAGNWTAVEGWTEPRLVTWADQVEVPGPEPLPDVTATPAFGVSDPVSPLSINLGWEVPAEYAIEIRYGAIDSGWADKQTIVNDDVVGVRGSTVDVLDGLVFSLQAQLTRVVDGAKGPVFPDDPGYQYDFRPAPEPDTPTSSNPIVSAVPVEGKFDTLLVTWADGSSAELWRLIWYRDPSTGKVQSIWIANKV